ncbi:MAG: S-adenosylmethionine:tRNA ribosyltransferase-isomerase, partial [Bacteroidota bacterium]
FCLEPLSPVDYQLSLSSREPVIWACLIGGNRRWKSGETTINIDRPSLSPIALHIKRGARLEGGSFSVDFRWSDTSLSWGEILMLIGQIPLPPYLGRAAKASDRKRYQTVFAKQEGSVAAPTAGLHFTSGVLEELKAKDCQWTELVLHVGAGTFKPVSSETLEGHEMHREYIELSLDTLQNIHQQLEQQKPIICVGTTSLRSLESCYHLGRLAQAGQLAIEDREENSVVKLAQWTAIDTSAPHLAPADAMRQLIKFLEQREMDMLRAHTQLIIAPGIPPMIADAIITNFHQPRSTLLLIIAAMTGSDWKKIYAHALQNEYRFLSYGDSSLLWIKKQA